MILQVIRQAHGEITLKWNTPGLPVLGLGYAVLAGHPISELARPYMQEIADRHQGAVSLGVRDGLSMMYLQRCQGTLIVLHGLLPHASSANRSARPRHAYALHLIDGRAAYDADNWLQRPTLPLRGFP